MTPRTWAISLPALRRQGRANEKLGLVPTWAERVVTSAVPVACFPHTGACATFFAAAGTPVTAMTAQIRTAITKGEQDPVRSAIEQTRSLMVADIIGTVDCPSGCSIVVVEAIWQAVSASSARRHWLYSVQACSTRDGSLEQTDGQIELPGARRRPESLT